jgi:hypothetical protein
LAPPPSPRRALTGRTTRRNEEWGLLPGQNRGPRPGHQWGLFHGHGQRAGAPAPLARRTGRAAINRPREWPPHGSSAGEWVHAIPARGAAASTYRDATKRPPSSRDGALTRRRFPPSTDAGPATRPASPAEQREPPPPSHPPDASGGGPRRHVPRGQRVTPPSKDRYLRGGSAPRTPWPPRRQSLVGTGRRLVPQQDWPRVARQGSTSRTALSTPGSGAAFAHPDQWARRSG